MNYYHEIIFLVTLIGFLIANNTVPTLSYSGVVVLIGVLVLQMLLLIISRFVSMSYGNVTFRYNKISEFLNTALEYLFTLSLLIIIIDFLLCNIINSFIYSFYGMNIILLTNIYGYNVYGLLLLTISLILTVIFRRKAISYFKGFSVITSYDFMPIKVKGYKAYITAKKQHFVAPIDIFIINHKNENISIETEVSGPPDICYKIKQYNTVLFERNSVKNVTSGIFKLDLNPKKGVHIYIEQFLCEDMQEQNKTINNFYLFIKGISKNIKGREYVIEYPIKYYEMLG